MMSDFAIGPECNAEKLLMLCLNHVEKLRMMIPCYVFRTEGAIRTALAYIVAAVVTVSRV